MMDLEKKKLLTSSRDGIESARVCNYMLFDHNEHCGILFFPLNYVELSFQTSLEIFRKKHNKTSKGEKGLLVNRNVVQHIKTIHTKTSRSESDPQTEPRSHWLVAVFKKHPALGLNDTAEIETILIHLYPSRNRVDKRTTSFRSRIYERTISFRSIVWSHFGFGVGGVRDLEFGGLDYSALIASIGSLVQRNDAGPVIIFIMILHLVAVWIS